MVILSAIVLQCLFLQSLGYRSYAGLLLTNIAEKVLVQSSDTSDICILNVSNDWPWIDLMDDFIPSVSSNFVINHVEFLAAASRMCFFYLIMLKPPSNVDEYILFTRSLILDRLWNRYGKFVFVMISEANSDWSLYHDVTKSLGIVRSVLLIVGIGGGSIKVFHYDYFRMKQCVLKSVDEIVEVLNQEVKNAYGHPFIALLNSNPPLLFKLPNRFYGFQIELMITFARHINATLLERGPHRFNETILSQLFARGSIHVINEFKPVKKFSEIMVTSSQPGLCFMIPEKVIGSLFNHLLRPFTVSAVIGVTIYIIVSQLSNKWFSAQLPRSILEQIFFGSLLAGYKMSRIERFTLFVGSTLLFILSEAYTAKLFQFVFNQKNEPHLQLVNDLSRLNNLIYGEEFHISRLQELYPQLQNRTRIIHNQTDDYLKNEVICKPCIFTTMYERSTRNINSATGARKYYILPEKIAMLTEAYTHSRFHPFTLMFKMIYARFEEAGLVNFCVRSSLLDSHFNEQKRPDILESDDLFSLWKLVAVGYVISTVVFIVEFGKHYINQYMPILLSV